MVCPVCHLSLQDQLHTLVEFHPHKRASSRCGRYRSETTNAPSNRCVLAIRLRSYRLELAMSLASMHHAILGYSAQSALPCAVVRPV